MRLDIFLGLIILILLLVSCSSQDEFVVLDNDTVNADKTVVDESKMAADANKTQEPGSKPADVDVQEEEKQQPPANEPESLTTSVLLIEKRIGEYQFAESRLEKSQALFGEKFNSYNAEYSFGKTKAVVSVMIPLKSANLYTLVNRSFEADDFMLLDSDELDFLKKDVYFNPYDNTYLWISKDKIITVKRSIGTDLLDEYLDKYAPSVLSGTFQNKEVTLNFDGERDEKIMFLNNNQYVIQMYNIDSDEVLLSVNGEKYSFDGGEKAIVGNLLISIESINPSEKKVRLVVQKEVLEKQTFNLDVGVPVSFSVGGESGALTLIGANSQKMNIQLEVDGSAKTVDLKGTKTFGDFEVKLDKLFVTNIGEKTTTIVVSIWKR